MLQMKINVDIGKKDTDEDTLYRLSYIYAQFEVYKILVKVSIVQSA